jgi:hypothetical protein
MFRGLKMNKLLLAVLLVASPAIADNPVARKACPTSEPLVLEAGWEHYGAPFATPMVFKDCSGLVRIEAGIRYTGAVPVPAIFPVAFVLPAGYLPASYEIFSMTTNLVPGEIHVTPGGGVVVVGDYAPTLAIFSGVSYRSQ